MQIQLFHNKILRNTLTPGFERSVNESLVPLVLSECPDATGILMYEDYIADGFSSLGAWYYPLTVFRGEEASTLWVKWAVNKKHFTDGCPYAYVGEDCIDFAVAEDVPDAFLKVREGRRIAPYSGTVSVDVDAAHPDPLFLAGRYSQSFVDELAYQMTAALERTAEVEGIANSSITLSLIFAPGTYMEHTSEGVTYRRLLINAKGCQPRDLWVKWSRPDGSPCTVGTHLAEGEAVFEIGEGVPQRIREKEYRYLAVSNSEKYRSAMGKKTTTEWREIIKRAVKRDEIKKAQFAPVLTVNEDTSALEEAFIASLLAAEATLEPDADLSEENEGGFDELMALARATFGEPEVEDEVCEPVSEPAYEEDELMAMLRRVVAGEKSEEPYDKAEEDTLTAEIPEAIEAEIEEEEAEAEKIEAEIEEEEAEEIEEEIEEAEETEEIIEKTAEDDVPFDLDTVTYEAPTADLAPEEEQNTREERSDEDAVRAEIEAKIRLEYEAKARARAEEEAEAMRLEHDRLRRECERLAELAKLAEERLAKEENARRDEEERIRRENARRDQEEMRLRREIEAQALRETRERERLAEAARLAVEEQRRLEAERLADEDLARKEQAQRQKAEDEARREAERLREIERINAMNREATPAPAPKSGFVSRKASLMFRRTPDPAVAGRIQKIVEDTLVSHGKEHIHIHMKARLTDSTIILDILKFPEEENELLISIIKAIGNGNLGITKIILE